MKAIKSFLLIFLLISIIYQCSNSQGLYAPPNGAGVTQPVKFLWYRMAGATMHRLNIYIGITLIYSESTTDTTLTVSGFSITTTYSWRVTYRSASDSITTSPWTFIVIAPPPSPPILYSPPNNSGATAPVKFIWYKSLGAASYRLQLSLDSLFTNIIYNSTTTDSFMTVSGIATSLLVYWHVNAANAFGTGLWSSTWKCLMLTPVKRDIDFLPISFKLYDSYPNPFNPTTTVRIDIPKECDGKLIVYNALGEEIETLINEHLKAGAYYITITNDNLSSGLYFYRFISELYSDTKKMILLK